ncbi:MAG: hypothetical protein ABJA86_12705 [Nocardioidaceae bacterium]
MTRMERFAPLTGIVAIVLFVAEAIVSGDTPNVDDPAQEIVAYWSHNAGTQEIAASLFGLAAVAIVWFGASIRAALRQAAGGADRLGSLAHAGTGLIAVGLSIYASFGLAAAHSAGDVPASTTQTFNVLSRDDMFVLLAVGAALLLLSTALAVLRHGGLPRWIGWVSLVLGVVALVALVLGPAVSGVGFVAFLALVLWIPAVGILIYKGQSSAA